MPFKMVLKHLEARDKIKVLLEAIQMDRFSTRENYTEEIIMF